MSDLGKVCEHGQLARVCLTCEQAAEIERLTAECDAWRKLVEEHNMRCIDRCAKECICQQTRGPYCPGDYFINIPRELDQPDDGGAT